MENYKYQAELHYISYAMAKELEKPEIDQSKFVNSIWFYSQEGKFLWNDWFMPYELIMAFLECGGLVYVGIDTHQGEIMPRYTLKKQ